MTLAKIVPILSATRLRVERLHLPVGIVAEHPELTWELRSETPGDFQTAFEIEVDHLDVQGLISVAWRTGKVVAPLGREVLYEGLPLVSRAIYRWRVRVWDAQDQSGDWSGWHDFETGILTPDQLAAQWIGGGGALRKEFQLAAQPIHARAYVTGLGYYKFYCNGATASAAKLAPSYTDFSKRIEYEIIDLLPLLQVGDNAIGFLLGDGWWRFRKDNPLCALAELCFWYADGRVEFLRTDATWSVAVGPISPDPENSQQQIYDGVTTDNRLLERTWSEVGGARFSWAEAALTMAPTGKLEPILMPPIRVTEIRSPYAINRLSQDRCVVDFGQNFAGFVRLKATGSAGAKIILRHAELLLPDGTINDATLKTAKSVDRFVLRGDDEPELLEPLFTYHGFRYVQIEGDLSVVDWDSVTGCVMHSDLEPTLEFQSSDAQLEWLVEASKWTVRANLQSIPTDCCQRDERQGWLMDGYLAFNSSAYLFDADTLYRKWHTDICDIQKPDGTLASDSAPPYLECTSIGWSRAMILVPCKLYRMYGDVAALRKAYPAMRRYMDGLLAIIDDGLLDESYSRHSAEWLCIGHQARSLSDNPIVYNLLSSITEAARVLGIAEDQARYGLLATAFRDKYNKHWFQPETGYYEGGAFFVQANQVYALKYDLVPEGFRDLALERLLDDLIKSRGTGEPFPTGGIGSAVHLLDVLVESGRLDVAWRLIQRKSYPSWGFMKANGATAIWERWEHMTHREMNAHNHAGFSGVGGWVCEHIAGISVVPGDVPVFTLKPAIYLPIENLSLFWQSRWGRVSIAWRVEGDDIALEVDIPVGCVGSLSFSSSASPIRLASGFHRQLEPRSVVLPVGD